jgi:hypothetical protein
MGSLSDLGPLFLSVCELEGASFRRVIGLSPQGSEVIERPWTSPPECLRAPTLFQEKGAVVQLFATRAANPS